MVGWIKNNTIQMNGWIEKKYGWWIGKYGWLDGWMDTN